MADPADRRSDPDSPLAPHWARREARLKEREAQAASPGVERNAAIVGSKPFPSLVATQPLMSLDGAVVGEIRMPAPAEPSAAPPPRHSLLLRGLYLVGSAVAVLAMVYAGKLLSPAAPQQESRLSSRLPVSQEGRGADEAKGEPSGPAARRADPTPTEPTFGANSASGRTQSTAAATEALGAGALVRSRASVGTLDQPEATTAATQSLAAAKIFSAPPEPGPSAAVTALEPQKPDLSSAPWPRPRNPITEAAGGVSSPPPSEVTANGVASPVAAEREPPASAVVEKPAAARSVATVAAVAPPAGAKASLPGVAAAARETDPAELAALVDRARALIAAGDVAAARLLLRRAAEAHSARAAFILGQTYDPNVLARVGAFGVEADVAAAREWYERAREYGSTEASGRLEALTNRAQ